MTSGKDDEEPSGIELPSQRALDDPQNDAREVFIALKTWAKERRRPGEVAASARELLPEYRQSVLAFLCSLPARKPLFRNQSRELLKVLSSEADWCSGCSCIIEDAVATALLPPAAPVKKGAPEKSSAGDGSASPSTVPEASSPESVLKAMSPRREKEEDYDVLDGLPPPEAFAPGSKFDDGDTFKDFRKWARGRPVWDLASAASRLEVEQRRNIFDLLFRIAGRKIYSRQAPETLSMLLSVEEWVMDGVVDEEACDKVFEEHAKRGRAPSPAPAASPKAAGGGARPPGSPRSSEPFKTILIPSPSPTPSTPPPSPPPRPSPPPSSPPVQTIVPEAPAKPKAGYSDQPRPSPAPPPTPAKATPARPEKPAAGKGGRLEPPEAVPAVRPKPAPKAGGDAKAGKGNLRARVEGALAGGAPIASGEELVKLYKASGLGGEASLSAKAMDGGFLALLLSLAGQRLKDLFIDPLQDQTGAKALGVHFPHLYIDLQRRNVLPMPSAVQMSVEQKIKRSQRWTCLEKAQVLCAKHELAIKYVLAYALTRAQASGNKSAVWIPLGMTSGSVGHANSVCLQAPVGKPSGPYKVYVYDPNFTDGGCSHWVHAQKAVGDALPAVKRLLDGTGISVETKAELFGHGLQTLLGTTSTSRGWFSKTVVTTQRGYPICGSVVFLLGSIWLGASAQAGRLDDILEVEKELASVVTESDAGKLAVQRKVAQILIGLAKRTSSSGADPFEKAIQRKLDADRKDWPPDQVKGGGSVTVSIPDRGPFEYKW
eukprot:TRINITY_DN81255_c0_g1_i1.p1 TRINITY_DN81255_c0_g1~~TRINITY_DN81255_c0_g1_i1.p1  ORF type:complete len:771 (+),score=123.57 TRINITY_DN81255_c0_g1_i1:119-2431(+)